MCIVRTDVVFGDDAVVAEQQHVGEVQRAARTSQQQVLAGVRAQQGHLIIMFMWVTIPAVTLEGDKTSTSFFK